MDFTLEPTDYQLGEFTSPLDEATMNFASILSSGEGNGPLPTKKASKSAKKTKPDQTEISEEELYQRRKAQNRAAQRAFRERKEGKLKELSEKLEEAEQKRLKLEKELDEIKQKNILLDMENQYLQQNRTFGGTSITSQNTVNSSTPSPAQLPSNNGPDTTRAEIESQFVFPSGTKAEFIVGTLGANNLSKHQLTENKIKEKSRGVGSSYEVKEERVLTISAVWDYIMEFLTLNEELDVDVAKIMAKLRGKEVCHGFGPAYPLEMINQVIMDTVNE